MKRTIYLILLLLPIVAQAQTTIFKYDKKGNQTSRYRNVTLPPVIYVSGDTSIHKGNSVRLEASGGMSYTWSTGDQTAAIEVQPAISTKYFVSIRDVCQVEKNDSVKVEVIQISQAAAPAEMINFEVSPNPATDIVRVQFDLPRAGKTLLRLSNLTGDVLLQQTFSTQNLSWQCPIEHLPSGIYQWTLMFEGELFTQKFAILK